MQKNKGAGTAVQSQQIKKTKPKIDADSNMVDSEFFDLPAAYIDESNAETRSALTYTLYPTNVDTIKTKKESTWMLFESLLCFQ